MYNRKKDFITILNIIRENKDVIDVYEEDLKSWSEKLRQSVDTSLTIDSFKVYKNSNNIILSGSVPSLNDLTFNFSLDTLMGLDITVESLPLNNEVIDKISRLNGVYLNWKDEMNVKLKDEYLKEI